MQSKKTFYITATFCFLTQEIQRTLTPFYHFQVQQLYIHTYCCTFLFICRSLLPILSFPSRLFCFFLYQKAFWYCSSSAWVHTSHSPLPMLGSGWCLTQTVSSWRLRSHPQGKTPPSQSQQPSSINTNLYYVAHTYVGTVRQEEQKVLTFRISQGYGIWLTTVPSCTDPLHM